MDLSNIADQLDNFKDGLAAFHTLTEVPQFIANLFGLDGSKTPSNTLSSNLEGLSSTVKGLSSAE
ncbi:hypothetical protein [Corynebacterium vitaeruminis]|uniref:Uncharacterized protein n=1 Tax=Corynebacterium vitaeruminis DSM 20294 TaxID=1224164 RepID=W5YAS2_9CORY|nr:hypothetical protein [Corynebacterium vitaeruminis]AHI23638.1 hypothetical protein B843_11300 [Corynebacterium vitaeruminis DSM 20294]